MSRESGLKGQPRVASAGVDRHPASATWFRRRCAFLQGCGHQGQKAIPLSPFKTVRSGLRTCADVIFLLFEEKLYKDVFRWGETDHLRLAVVLDEAHRLSRDITLPKLMKEGRKFGIVVISASQGVTDFHPDVLGNAGTKVIFRTNFTEGFRIPEGAP